MIKIVAEFHVLDGKIDEYIKTAKLLEAESQKEDGCVYYVVHQDINNPNVITMLETWESEEAIAAHNESEHIKKYGPILRSLRDPVINIRKYKEV